MEEHPITPLIRDLTAANQRATQAIANNSAFNRTIQASLAGINTQITQIAQGIRGLQERLADSERQIGQNQATIGEHEAENRRLAQESETAVRERTATAEELENLRRERLRIEEDAARRQQENEKELQQLQEDRVRETDELRGASEDERARLQQQLEETNHQIAGLTQDNQNIVDTAAQNLQILSEQRGELERKLQESTANIQIIEAERAGLDRDLATLREENQRLNKLLSDVVPQMQLAIDNLAALSETGSQGDTQQLIANISQQLDTIKGSLGIDAQQPIQVEINRAVGLDENTKITKTYMSNQKLTEKTFTLRALIVAISDSQIRDYKNIIQRIKNSSNVEKINTILDGIGEGRLASVLDRVAQSSRGGGRKTRRRKRVGTRKGKKTRRARKQKGGFQYKAHTRRKRISTTSRRSSNRRSSTRRTSSM